MLLARQALGRVLGRPGRRRRRRGRPGRRRTGTPSMIGRTLLQQAVPVTFGLVAAGWLTGLDRRAPALARVRPDRLAVQFGGAAGTLAALATRARGWPALLAAELGLAARRCPGTPTGCGSSRSPRRSLAWPRRVGKVAGDVPCWPSPRSPRWREGGGGRAAAARRPCRTSRTRWPPSPCSAAPARPGLLATLVGAAEQEQQRGGRGLARRVGTAARPAPAHRVAASWAADLLAGLARRPGPDAGQPGRHGRLAAGRARRRAARAGPRAGRRARPGRPGQRAGGGGWASRCGRPPARRARGGPAGGGPA